MQPQRLRFQRIPQRRFQRQTLLRLTVHFRAEERNAVPPRRLRLIHRHVRMAQQRIHIAAVLREHADPDTDRRIQRHAAHRKRLGQRHQDMFRRRRQTAMLEVRHQHHKLVARQAAHDVRRPRQPAQTLRHIPQQRIADGMSQRIVHLLESIQVQEQHRHPLAFRLRPRNRLLGLRQQQIAVRQARQLVIERQLTNTRARFLAFQRQRAQIHTHIHQPMMKIVRQTAFAEVKAERTDHPAIAGLDGRRPACLDVFRQRQMAVVVPQRVRRDVRHDDRPTQERRRAAGAHVRTNLHPVQRAGVGVRHARRRQRAQMPRIVHPQHRRRHFGRQALDLAAHHVHDLDHRRLVHHGLQHAALQHLVHLGGRNVGQHIHDVDQRATVIEDRVGHDRHPQRLAAAVIDQHVFMEAFAASDAAVQFFARAAVRASARQQLAQFLMQRVAARKAQHALKAVVHVDDAAIATGHRHRVARFVDAQQQQADLFLPFRVGNRLARHHRHAGDGAVLVGQRQVRGFDPQAAAVFHAVATRAGKMFAPTQARPDAFAAGDALAFIQAVAQHVVAQRQRLFAGIANRRQEIGVGLQ